MINKAIRENLSVIGNWKNVQVLWQCGGYYYEQLERELRDKLPANVVLTAFLKRMDLAYACADIVIARAGAGTISELVFTEKNGCLDTFSECSRRSSNEKCNGFEKQKSGHCD